MIPVTANDKLEQALCPIRSVLNQVTGKWQILIVFALEDGALRFGELKRLIGDITQRVLTENLRGLEKDGYLTRTVFEGPPLAVSYELTKQGDDFVGHLKPVIYWANDILPAVKESRVMYENKQQQIAKK
ncbi:MAG: helix-turn-helix domain-containing protein [Pseudomonadota bacterium]